MKKSLAISALFFTSTFVRRKCYCSGNTGRGQEYFGTAEFDQFLATMVILGPSQGL